MSKIADFVNAGLNYANRPKSFRDGDKFEDWVIQGFDKRYFDLLKRTSDSVQNSVRYAVGDRDYDFLMFDKWLKREFAVECKYRSESGTVDLCTPEKFEHYKKVAASVPFFFVLGVGGKPNQPVDVFVIPILKIKYSRFVCGSDFAKRFSLDVDFIYSNHLWSGF
ncbi:hypothetical protein [Arachidicoccus terrestris]|uniref:hypothetical protein n=1 Tax=Arachidicoccus terrestris TaxID=2875539 RepID=UPI001CC5F331|nr:hypothetical protein [Arachidicoccus terrestris]UAY54786.1 hypothetical protein K9M52_15260 [Arachidicoccus terrestris]